MTTPYKDAVMRRSKSLDNASVSAEPSSTVNHYGIDTTMQSQLPDEYELEVALDDCDQFTEVSTLTKPRFKPPPALQRSSASKKLV